jgi:glucose/arabinose dehydrogenase
MARKLRLRQICRIDFDKGRIAGQTTLLFKQRICRVGQGPDGGISVLTDEIDGRLLWLMPD